MQSVQSQAVQDHFTRTAEAFSVYAPRDTAEVLARRLDFAGLVPHQVALDVACGPGAFVLAAARRVRFARGFDLTAEMLRMGRRFQQERNIANAAFDRGDAEHLPYRAGTFDLVCCQFAFHHMPDSEAVLREMLRVARPGGRIFVADSLAPEDESKSALHDHIERLRDPSHTATLSPARMTRLFGSYGLAILKQDVRRQARSFDHWMLRAGAGLADESYQATRRALEASIPGDRAGYSAERCGNDFTIFHQEGMFLLAKPA